MINDYEKLGVFYIGREYDITRKKTSDIPVLFKSRNLTTHAAIIGMTGSGKTGLGIGLIEEAAIDQIPVIAIDPKGDLGNLLLTFPEFDPDDFLPWINQSEASKNDMSMREYAAKQAATWEKGLMLWDQDPERIRRLKDSAEFSVYTPGSTAGIGISILKSFNAPKKQFRDDYELYLDRIHSTATGILSLIGSNQDPLSSREHILISNILEHSWGLGLDLTLASLISLVQEPPMQDIGVMDINSFYPPNERFALAMKLNNLLASPVFKTWLEGESLDIDKLMYTSSGKPRVSILSIAHLSENERMFFVTMLLNEILTWTRAQSGTSSLRAILYMDELFGYLPPSANPPSKKPLMTLLKQARAYGLGVVLSTQNPVDLDYKALSNTGTWFIGRLQTERDKQRVIAGLEGASAGSGFDKRKTEQILAGLGQRMFYLHSVHDDEPLIFNTRWVMSYLAGPLTRDQIAKLPNNEPEEVITKKTAVYETEKEKTPLDINIDMLKESAPVVPQQIKQYFYDPKIDIDKRVYKPGIIVAADVFFSSAKYSIALSKRFVSILPVLDTMRTPDWKTSFLFDDDIDRLTINPKSDNLFDPLPGIAKNLKTYETAAKAFSQFLRMEKPLLLYYSPLLKVVSGPDEDERDFRIRLQQLAHERRDEAMDALRKKYTKRINTLKDRQSRARQTLIKENAMVTQKRMDAALSAGTAVLGALFGRKTISATTVSRAGSAFRSSTRAAQGTDNITAAREALAEVEQRLKDIEIELEGEVHRIHRMYDIKDEKPQQIPIRPTAGNINIFLTGLIWYGK